VLLALAEGCPRDRRGVESLQGLHATQQARLEVLHLAGVAEVARQLDEGALHHPRSLAEVAAFERGVLRAALFFP